MLPSKSPRFFITLLVLFFLAIPCEAGIIDNLRALWQMCGARAHVFTSDKEASEWLAVTRQNMHLSKIEELMVTFWPGGNISSSINRDIRAGREPDRDRVLETEPLINTGMILDLFDRLHGVMKTDRSLVAYRGVAPGDLGSYEKGSIIQDDGYMNLSIRRESPEYWARHRSSQNPVLLQLTVPKGYPVIPVGRIGYVWGELQGGELAIVPKRHTKFEVTDITHEGNLTIVHGSIVP